MRPAPTSRPTRKAITSPPASKASAKWTKALEATFGEAETVKAVWRAQNNISVDEETAQSLMKLIDLLEGDDVQNVYSNF